MSLKLSPKESHSGKKSCDKRTKIQELTRISLIVIKHHLKVLPIEKILFYSMLVLIQQLFYAIKFSSLVWQTSNKPNW